MYSSNPPDRSPIRRATRAWSASREIRERRRRGYACTPRWPKRQPRAPTRNPDRRHPRALGRRVVSSASSDAVAVARDGIDERRRIVASRANHRQVNLPGGHPKRHVPKQPKVPFLAVEGGGSKRVRVAVEKVSDDGFARRLEALALVDDVPAEDSRRLRRRRLGVGQSDSFARLRQRRARVGAGAVKLGRRPDVVQVSLRDGESREEGVEFGSSRESLGVVFRRRLRLRARGIVEETSYARDGGVGALHVRRGGSDPRGVVAGVVGSFGVGDGGEERVEESRVASAETVRVGSEGERLVAADPGEGLVLEPVGEGAGVRARPAGVRFSGEEIAERGGAAGDRGRRVAVRRAGTGRCWGHRGEAARGSGGRQRPLGNAAASGRDRRAAIVTRATPACIPVT